MYQAIADAVKKAAKANKDVYKRQLLGDYVLSQDDIDKNVAHEDASFTTTWSIDLHFPDSVNSVRDVYKRQVMALPKPDVIMFILKSLLKLFGIPIYCLMKWV